MIDTSKIIIGTVGGGRYTVTAPIVKEDYGLYLQIKGLELPSTYEVDFSNSEHNGTSVTMIGNSDGVLIPSQFIKSGKDVFAFLYHVGADFGRTVYKFRIPNKLRPDRTNEQPTPEEQSTIDQAISALNTAVEQTAQDVIDADASAQSASQSAENAHDSAVDAQNYAESASGYASDAQGYATIASQKATEAGNSADQAAQIKTDIEDYVSTAQTAAQTATDKASQASQSATNASNSATTAATKAGEASASATTANNKASEASGYASTASQKATESAQSATNAQTYASQAESAKTASQTAQGLAESARDTAVSAKDDAESARDDAESARDEAQQAVASISGALAEKAPVITDTASGSIASFTDGADDIPMKSLVVDINPVQDLHGQDSPYPAGGGKNLFGLEKWLSDNDIEYTKSGDSYTFSLAVVLFTRPFVFSETDTAVTLSFESFSNGTSVSARMTLLDSSNSAIRTIYADSANVKATGTACKVRLDWQTGGAGTVTIKAPQIEFGSTATTYAPYENLCPISGWTEVDVEQSGKNLFDKSVVEVGILKANGTVQVTGSTKYVSGYIRISPNTSYYLSNVIPATDGRSGFWYDADKNPIEIISKTPPTLTSFAVVSPSNAEYARIGCYVASADICQLELGSTATPYEPYTGRSININLGQTVYGGKLDVLSGELVIDMAMVDLGSLTWRKLDSYEGVFNANIQGKADGAFNLICSAYATSSDGSAALMPDCSIVANLRGAITFVKDISKASMTATEFKEAVSGFMCCYEIASPIEIQLTPNQLNSLYGVNNIWADTGDTEVVYRADTKLYIERLTAPDSADMIADANITSGKYFMVGNSLFKATANIANGAQIIIGTNCIRKSLSEALNEINA